MKKINWWYWVMVTGVLLGSLGRALREEKKRQVPVPAQVQVQEEKKLSTLDCLKEIAKNCPPVTIPDPVIIPYPTKDFNKTTTLTNKEPSLSEFLAEHEKLRK